MTDPVSAVVVFTSTANQAVNAANTGAGFRNADKTVHGKMLDVVMMLVFGLVGYAFKKLKYPLAPLVLALVLGDMAESSFRQSMLISNGSLGVFWSNPLCGTIATLGLLLLVWPLISKAWAAIRK